jgi:hypothetical protein
VRLRLRFNLVRRLANLTMQLQAKSQELRDAHRALAKAEASKAFYVAECDRRDKERRTLIAAHEDEKRRLHDQHDRALVPTVSTAATALGSRDRQNAVRLAFENDGLRAEAEHLRRENARLAVLVDECQTKHGEGNPA